MQPLMAQGVTGELGQAEVLQRASEGLGDTDVFQMSLPDSYAGCKCCGLGRLEKGVSGSFYECVLFFHPPVLFLL